MDICSAASAAKHAMNVHARRPGCSAHAQPGLAAFAGDRARRLMRIGDGHRPAGAPRGGAALMDLLGAGRGFEIAEPFLREWILR